MIHRSSISRFLNNREIKDPQTTRYICRFTILNNREIKDPQTNRYICRLYGFTRSKCWLASPQLPACRRLLFPLSACNKGNRRGLHAGNPADVLGFVRHAFISLQ